VIRELHEIRRLDVIRSGDTLKAGSFPMKTFARCAFLILLGSGAFAQRHGVGNSVGTNAGYGNVVFPGGRPTINTPFTPTPGVGFARSIGNVVAGRPAFNGNFHRNANSGAVVYVPYAYPVYSGAGYYGGYGGYYAGYGDPSAMPPPQQQPNITIIYPPQQPPPMMVTQPQAPPANAMIQEYGPSQTAAPTDTSQRDADYYLLAFKDHSIYSAVGYWVDGDTLHYITTGNVHNQVSLSLVDRDLTLQLNKGRGVQVTLPPSR
jgi:hypothetical protein